MIQKDLFASRVVGGATWSPKNTHRYTLSRIWDEEAKSCTFIGLNPSTATEEVNDPTVTRCVNFARSWGYGRMNMLNLFAIRATDPKVMLRAKDPVGENNDTWLRMVCQYTGIIICAWGTHGNHLGRQNEVVKLLGKYPLYHLGLNQDGTPKHPLYLRKDLTPILWEEKCGHLKEFGDGSSATIETGK